VSDENFSYESFANAGLIEEARREELDATGRLLSAPAVDNAGE